MKTIHKYIIVNGGIEMPEGAKILSVAVQRGVICAWAMIDTASPMTLRQFSVYGTGHEVSMGGDYVGTVHAHHGLVWHIFDLGER